MLDIEIKELNISIELKRKIKMICRFHNLKCEFINGSIKNIRKTNIAYVEPNKVIINNQVFLLFEDCKFIFLDTLDNKISISELDKHLKPKE